MQAPRPPHPHHHGGAPRPHPPRPNGPRPQTGFQPQAWQPQVTWQQPGQQQHWQNQQWQQQPGHPYPYQRPYPRPRRRMSPWLTTLLIGAPLLVIGLVVVIIATSVAGLGSSTSPQSDPYPPTTTYPSSQSSVPPPSTYPTTPTSAPPPSTSAPKPTIQPRSKSGSKPEQKPTSKPKAPTRPDLRKQHGYDQIPLPTVPASLGTAKQTVADDKLYDESVSKHLCPDGPPMDRYPYPSLSDSQIQAWLQRIADCDQAMWARPVAEAGFQATKVKVRMIEADKIYTPCGTQYRGQFAAFYCSGDQELYVDPTLGNPAEAHTYDWGQYWEVVSHEYGHSIQARTGIFTSASMLESSAGSASAANRWSRRIELQAQCFSGLAVSRVGGMSTARYQQQVRFETTRNLAPTHGSGAHQSAWFAQGHKYRQVFQCDTFKASVSDVS